MDWKEYEAEIYRILSKTYPNAHITQNVMVDGRYSKVKRQVDVMIEERIAGFHLKIVIDAKFRNKKIDVTDVEAFIGYCEDIGASKGVLISLEGYTDAANSRAHFDESDIEFQRIKGVAGVGRIRIRR